LMTTMIVLFYSTDAYSHIFPIILLLSSNSLPYICIEQKIWSLARYEWHICVYVCVCVLMYVYMYICVYMYMYIYVQMCVYVYTVVARQNARATFADGACQIAGTMPKRTSTWQLAPISLLAPTLFTERVKTFRLVRDYFSSSGVSVYTCV